MHKSKKKKRFDEITDARKCGKAVSNSLRTYMNKTWCEDNVMHVNIIMYNKSYIKEQH